MALAPAKNIPKDAVVVNEMEAINYVWNLISDWKPVSDTWALRYSAGILGAINAIGGLVINKYYRRKLKLGTYGHFSSALPILVLPSVFTALFHRHAISTNILLMKKNACPICYEIKSAVIQCSFGIAYPMCLGPTAAFLFANRYCTYRLPSLVQNPKELFQFWVKITKPLSGTLIFLIALQVLSSSVLTYYQIQNNATIRRKLIEIEKRIDIERST